MDTEAIALKIQDAIDALVDEKITERAAAYEPIPHDEWKQGEVIVNTRTSSVAIVGLRKTAPHDNPFPGWWVNTIDGVHEGGGVADFAKDWRSVKCLVAERRSLGLQ